MNHSFLKVTSFDHKHDHNIWTNAWRSQTVCFKPFIIVLIIWCEDLNCRDSLEWSGFAIRCLNTAPFDIIFENKLVRKILNLTNRLMNALTDWRYALGKMKWWWFAQPLTLPFIRQISQLSLILPMRSASILKNS